MLRHGNFIHLPLLTAMGLIVTLLLTLAKAGVHDVALLLDCTALIVTDCEVSDRWFGTSKNKPELARLIVQLPPLAGVAPFMPQ